jgi:hypothetical protein
MGFFPVFCAGLFFLMACAGYLCCTSLLTKFRGAAIKVSAAVLAFGTSAYVGFIIVVVVVGNSPLRGLVEGRLQPFFFALAYIVPGLVGAWLTVMALESA